MSSGFWITDPDGHRALEVAGQPADGTEVDTPMGKAVIISMDRALGNVWVCDLCNAEMLTRWGSSSWPVACEGNYGLCIDCTEAVFTRGRNWPSEVCACPPCTFRLLDWANDMGWEIRAGERTIVQRRSEIE